MRVYLKPHAGQASLKQRIIEHLKRRPRADRLRRALRCTLHDDYPAFCIAAAYRTLSPIRRSGHRAGRSGNAGDAANKVPGARRALA